ncbi:glycine zipper domain-containing protein [Geobacter sp. SVR]|uniref:glycine zipper family protein n=1 Tax=Geobacter sp. SVR TaxID=2495594 RepID=UPI00143EF512|nr:glycine zipper domain-containing protein [Geobacter sp. SVR]BCS52872.1 hypothetical protein GSVR_11800 [Geobacter sp. SVR]GCF87495.1 hypothetical protein GSbR_40950 [Geobacter sp. SVR]
MNTGKKKLRAKAAIIYGIAAAMAAAVVASGPAGAQESFVYPNKGQSNEQMEQDKYSCMQWAKQQTGVDPTQMAQAPAPPPQQTGGVVKGGAGGAALGAIGGAIGGNAGKGAAIGAATGGIVGGVRQRRGNKEQEQYAQQQAADSSKRRSDYDRAWGACLEGKGYTVK